MQDYQKPKVAVELFKAILERQTYIAVNLTPHEISFWGQEDFEIFSVSPSGYLARVTTIEKEIESPIEGDLAYSLPLIQQEYGEIVDLPDSKVDFETGTFNVYIVSIVVLNALKQQGCRRKDVIAPDTGKGAVRNHQGQIIGTRRFICL